MYIVNGIAYADTDEKEMRIKKVRALDDKIMILTFDSGEERLYDASPLLSLPAFGPLKDDDVFKTPRIVDGIVTWADGKIDLAPETMYADSYPYQTPEDLVS